MTTLQTALIYIGLQVLFLLILKVNVGRIRAGEKVNFGDGGNERMQRAMRVQGNAIEDVPVLLLGLLGLALLNAPIWLIHSLGGTLLLARILHALGLGGSTGFSLGRFIGTLLTLLTYLGTAGACFWLAFT